MAWHSEIRGVEGRERSRVLTRTFHATTAALFDRLKERARMTCLHLDYGNGVATVESARRFATTGKSAGIDIDETTVELARQ